MYKRQTKECVSPHLTRETYHALLEQAYKRSPHPVRLLGAGVRFVDEVEDHKVSPQQLLALEQQG